MPHTSTALRGCSRVSETVPHAGEVRRFCAEDPPNAAVWSLKSSSARTRLKGETMNQKTSNRRTYGTGTLYVQERADGQELWYGRWHLGGRRPNRCLGPRRRRGTGEGLNRTQAEAKLRELMIRERPPAVGSSVSFASTADLMLRDLEASVASRPPSTTIGRSFARTSCPGLAKSPSARLRRAKSKRSWRR